MIDDRTLLGGHYACELEDPQVYAARRRRVQERLSTGDVAVLLGASDTRSYGDVGTFRQEPNFFYLTGVELPGAVLVLERDAETLYLPARKPALEAWLGPKFGPGEEAAQALGFAAVLERDAHEIVVDARRRPQPAWTERVAGQLAQGGALWLALPSAAASGDLTAEQHLAVALRDRLPSFRVCDLSPVLTELRLRKEGGELSLLRRAVAATEAAMRAAARAVRPGVGEGKVEGEAFAALRGAGAEGWSFPPIVGSGRAGCVLHYDANRGTLAEGELVVVDIGARWGYYCGDLTRTFPVSGQFSERQLALYGAVLAAYEAAVATLRAGVTLGEVRKAAFAALEASELSGDGGAPLSQFFIHGIGHFLGLEAHDVGGEAPPLAPGMVVTVEPGIYLPEEGVGIRIEDDWVVTEAGAECLSASLPREAHAVEALLKGER
ncbi:MAG: aminopeptidase P family protein [Thermoanaerobaculaceae bacterium]|nr:aminopeptidase P family protein [Thermoanaerobaculaceae bacterium]